jgi:hypothetical protein
MRAEWKNIHLKVDRGGFCAVRPTRAPRTLVDHLSVSMSPDTLGKAHLAQ